MEPSVRTAQLASSSGEAAGRRNEQKHFRCISDGGGLLKELPTPGSFRRVPRLIFGESEESWFDLSEHTAPLDEQVRAED